ncbi:Spindle pole body component alp14 [Nosema bombycis CQ1]|uniref:Spindle pole body component alp14 n=1 Tax=Nosema bombycis (strain CQ1 / CVCC 102059) TaxID=578461 RepID=R0MRL6_NOSB1|nr:Spindle pole body component alp14 [Nosema bombycis CQ1]|eukprot:EOB15543.1 Spindle pole body component alp14 [Nosema bombycis CQ1]
MNEVERLEEKMKSKNWKERQEAYVRLKSLINQEEFAFLIPLIQNETNIPALESGIEALLQAENIPPVESVAKIFGHIGNLKTSVRTKVVNLIEFVSQKYHNQCVNVLVDYILLKSTPPKTVAGAISALVEITDKYDVDLEIVGSSLKQIFGHADKAVRGEGTKLCVGLYKKFGEGIRKFIKDLKPIQLKELEEEFNKIQPEISKKESTPLSLTNNKFLKKCNDEKWNIRLEGLNELKACIPFTFDNEILSIFYTRISDPNNQVFFELLEILALTKLKNQRIVNGLVERLKDKKTIVCDKIKETLLKMEIPEEFLQKEYFIHKNPQVKINIIDYALKREVKRKEVEEWVKICTKDQNGQVRTKANEFLNNKNKVASNNNKVLNSVAGSNMAGNIVASSHLPNNKALNIVATPPANQNTPIKRVKTSYFGPTQEEKDSILNSFYSKYPFFKEKMWNTRLDALKDNTPLLLKEEIRDLIVFFYSHKENIFQLNLAHLDLLSKRQKELDLVRNTLLLYCTEKITENKLQNKIVEILKKIDQQETLSFLKNEIKNLKQGKKLVCLIWLVGELISKKNCEIDEILKKNVTGINEKKAIEGLKKRFEEVSAAEMENSEVEGTNVDEGTNGVEESYRADDKPHTAKGSSDCVEDDKPNEQGDDRPTLHMDRPIKKNMNTQHQFFYK